MNVLCLRAASAGDASHPVRNLIALPHLAFESGVADRVDVHIGDRHLSVGEHDVVACALTCGSGCVHRHAHLGAGSAQLDPHTHSAAFALIGLIDGHCLGRVFLRLSSGHV